MPSTNLSDAPSEIPGGPQPLTRTIVTFLLFLHLFALFVAVVSNDTGSDLTRGLRRVPGMRQYLQLLAMDLSYRFPLISGSDSDMDATVEVELKQPNGDTRTVVFPDPSLGRGERFHRYQRLPRQVVGAAANAEISGDDSNVGIIPSAVGGWLLRQNDATSGIVRIRGEIIRDMPSVRNDTPAEARTPYAADIKLSHNQVVLNKISSTGETAPAPDQK